MQTQGFLGMDISKGYADFLLLGSGKQVLEEGFQLDDTREGRAKLKELILGWLSQGMQELYCGVESTGGYENNWYSMLKGMSLHYPVKVVRLNGKGVKSVSEAALKRTVTDAVSAENIAVYLMSFPEKLPIDSESGEVFRSGRPHYTYIRMLQKQKVQLSNQLEKLLYQYFAEVLLYCRHGIPGWLLRLLSFYPCASVCMEATEKDLSGIKGISLEKARSLKEKSRESDQVIPPPVQHIIKATSREILHKQEMLGAEKKYLREIYQQHPQVELISSIPGIGIDTAILLMLEIEDIQRFSSAKKIAAYFGLHPTFKQSGDGVWGTRMSKKGRAEIRAALYMASMTGIRHNSILKSIYSRFRAKGMKHYQAMGVVMHKLLRMVYGILKNQTSFDVAIDQQNIERAQEKQKQQAEKKTQPKENKKHRYQPASIQAPISRKAAQNRKKQSVSQAS